MRCTVTASLLFEQDAGGTEVRVSIQPHTTLRNRLILLRIPTMHHVVRVMCGSGKMSRPTVLTDKFKN